MTSVNTKTSAELLAAKGLAAEMKKELTMIFFRTG